MEQKQGPFGTCETVFGDRPTTLEQQRAGVVLSDTEYTAFLKVSAARRETLLRAYPNGYVSKPFPWRFLLNVAALCLVAAVGYYVQQTGYPRAPKEGRVDIRSASVGRYVDDNDTCAALLHDPVGTVSVRPEWHLDKRYSYCALVNGPAVFGDLARQKSTHQIRTAAVVCGGLLLVLLLNILTRAMKLEVVLEE